MGIIRAMGFTGLIIQFIHNMLWVPQIPVLVCASAFSAGSYYLGALAGDLFFDPGAIRWHTLGCGGGVLAVAGCSRHYLGRR